MLHLPLLQTLRRLQSMSLHTRGLSCLTTERTD